MRKRRRVPGLSYANVVATLALFVALGGSAYAVKRLPKNSVGTGQLRANAVTKQKIRRNAVTAAQVHKNAITGVKIRNNAVTGAKVREFTLGTVPRAQTAETASVASVAGTANIANSVASPEGWHEVGANGEPEFLNFWANDEADDGPEEDESVGEGETAGFFKDREGIVHLKGRVSGGLSLEIFRLPLNYRPSIGRVLEFVIPCAGGVCTENGLGVLSVFGSHFPGNGRVVAPVGATVVGLDGITFRAES